MKSIEAKNLPWSTHLTSAWGNNYLIVEGVDVEVVYGGGACAYAGIPITVSGSAGGIVENSTETATFNNSTIIATGTGLWVGFAWVEWNGRSPDGSLRIAQGTGDLGRLAFRLEQLSAKAGDRITCGRPPFFCLQQELSACEPLRRRWGL